MSNRRKGPGKAHREGISLMQLGEMFPDEAAARTWFEENRWPDGRHCPRCGSCETRDVPKAKPMPYWCSDCASYFSVRTGSALEHSRLPLRKWVFAVYLYVTSLKGVSSMKLHRDLDVTQKTAWFMLHRLREAWDESRVEPMSGPIEADETYIGGARRNMHKSQRKGLPKSRGPIDKAPVAGLRDRASGKVVARAIERTDSQTLHSFIWDHALPGSSVYTDDHAAYRGIPYRHRVVRHSAGEYVKGKVHTQGIESFWAMLKRAHKGTFHKISPKHLNRYVNEFAGRHNVRDRDTIDQMQDLVASMVGKRLMYRDLVA